MTFLSTRALDGLRQYKYKPAGYTVIDDWHQPIWNCTIWSCVYGGGDEDLQEVVGDGRFRR